ncbi:hypothetical protein BsWGS_25744 [Bradybaena similaris]
MMWVGMLSRGRLMLLLIMTVVCQAAQDCAWSNEGCVVDSECCSKSCHRAHEGTNPRCRHSTLGEKCVFDYHCQDTLTCGVHYNCCSPYWKMCIKNSDCCDQEHVCRPTEGFLYNRCLYPSSRGCTPGYSTILSFASLICTVALTWLIRFAGQG